MAESGLPDLHVTTWNGLVAPAGIPSAIVVKLNATINDALRSPAIREVLDKGFRTADLSPQHSADPQRGRTKRVVSTAEMGALVESTVADVVDRRRAYHAV